MKRSRKYRYDGIHFPTDLALLILLVLAIAMATIYLSKP